MDIFAPAAPADNPPVFEGFAIAMDRPGQQRHLRRIVTLELGKGWKVKAFGEDRTDFEVTSPRRPLSIAEAWDATYRLRAQPHVVYAEPVFAVAIMNRRDWLTPLAPAGELAPALPEEAAIRDLCFGSSDLPESGDREWSLKAIRVLEAWERFFPGNPQPGAGIIIGHPDTGYQRHPEIIDNLLIERGFDFFRNDPNAEDELETGGLLAAPGHGTATGSVIVSPRGAPGGGAAPEAISGVAPGAKLIPLRIAPSPVFVLSGFKLAHAIEYATDQGAHIISMSMGGLLNWRLRQAVRYAQRRGVILLAAAGNCVPFVVWPAAYDEVVAVAASNARGATWRGSSRGGAVDVTAPGESVWCARVKRDAAGIHFDVEPGTGTSFAVATTAGVAALWLAHHGHDMLVNMYGAEKIPLIFNQILRDSCVAMHDPSWEPGKFGAGLIDAEAALAAPLPIVPESLVVAPALAAEEHPPVDSGREATFAHLFAPALSESAGLLENAPASSPLAVRLAELLGIPLVEVPTRLKEVGQELAFHFAVNPDLYRQFAAALAQPVVIPEESVEAAPPLAELETVRGLLVDTASAALRRRLLPTFEGRGAAPEAAPPVMPKVKYVGVNYYPALHPWWRMWCLWHPDAIRRELRLARQSGANTIRTFLPISVFSQHPEIGGVPGIQQYVNDERIKDIPDLATLLDRVDTFLSIAQEGKKLQVILGLFDEAKLLGTLVKNRTASLAYVNTVLARFGKDPRIAMWDLVNELDDQGDKRDENGKPLFVELWFGATPAAKPPDPQPGFSRERVVPQVNCHAFTADVGSNWLRDMYQQVAGASNQAITIGALNPFTSIYLFKMFEKHFPKHQARHIPQYHEYTPYGSSAFNTNKLAEQMSLIHIYTNRRALIGEFGYPTGGTTCYDEDGVRKCTNWTPDLQRQAMQFILDIAAKNTRRIEGLLYWTLTNWGNFEGRSDQFGEQDFRGLYDDAGGIKAIEGIVRGSFGRIVAV